MAKAIIEPSLDIILNVSTDEIVKANVEVSGLFVVDQYRVKRICTKTDNDSKAIMDAHLKERASHYFWSKVDTVASSCINWVLCIIIELTEQIYWRKEDESML